MSKIISILNQYGIIDHDVIGQQKYTAAHVHIAAVAPYS